MKMVRTLGAEETVNGYRLREGRLVDWERQAEVAVEAFEQQSFFVFVDGKQVDLVLSGVNRGRNVGEDVIYSGTVAGAMEGALLGIPSIALSLAARGATHFASAGRVARELVERFRWFIDARPELVASIHDPRKRGVAGDEPAARDEENHYAPGSPAAVSERFLRAWLRYHYDEFYVTQAVDPAAADAAKSSLAADASSVTAGSSSVGTGPRIR